MRSQLLRVVIVALLFLPGRRALAGPATSFNQLTTGNGFGFQLFDPDQAKLVEFLERPYRFLYPGVDPTGPGVLRRNLVYDLYFGVRAGTTGAWMKDVPQSLVELVEQSGTIHSAGTVGGARVDSYFIAPFGYAGDGLLALVEVTNTTSAPLPVEVFLNPNFHLGSATNPDSPGADGEQITSSAASSIESGPGGGAMIYAPIGGFDRADCSGTAYARVQAGMDLLGTPSSCSGTDITIDYQKSLGTLAPGASGWWGAGVLFDPSSDGGSSLTTWSHFLAGRTADRLLGDTLAEWRAWRKAPPAGLSAAETLVWRQAEATLRMAQILVPYSDAPKQKSYGMIVAALPPGEWDIPWVRDQEYATVALARMGHVTEAKRALDALLDAEAGRYEAYVNGPYRLSVVRYFGDGEEESDWNGDGPNVELDGWGLYLWAARSYVDASGDLAWLSQTTRAGEAIYQVLRDDIAAPLGERNVDGTGLVAPDTSIWEAHWNNRKHYAYTSLAAARGLCDFSALAARSGAATDAAEYAALSGGLASAARARLLDPTLFLAGSLEGLEGGRYHDAAVVDAFDWGLYPPSDPAASATLDGLSVLRVASGGYERNDNGLSTYDTNEWIFVDLRIADALRRAGRSAAASGLLAEVTNAAGPNFSLLPELYNDDPTAGPIGAYTGAIPMVGFGAGAYVLALLDRAGPAPDSSCGPLLATPDGGTKAAPPAAGGCQIGPSHPGAPQDLAPLALVFTWAVAWRLFGGRRRSTIASRADRLPTPPRFLRDSPPRPRDVRRGL